MVEINFSNLFHIGKKLDLYLFFLFSHLAIIFSQSNVTVPVPFNPPFTLTVNGYFQISGPQDGPGWQTTYYCGPPITAIEGGIPFSQYLGICNNQVARIQELDNGTLFTIPGITPQEVVGIQWGEGDPQSGLDFLPVTNVLVTEEPFLLAV